LQYVAQILVFTMIVTADNRREYLNSKPRAYRIGWYACENNLEHKRLDASELVNKQYTDGYGDCTANTESLSNQERIA